jgi:hypothetical protein
MKTRWGSVTGEQRTKARRLRDCWALDGRLGYQVLDPAFTMIFWRGHPEPHDGGRE